MACPKSAHEFLKIRFGDCEMYCCTECDFWWFQPSLSFTEPGDETSDDGQAYRARHSDHKELLSAAQEDSQAFYGKKLRSW